METCKSDFQSGHISLSYLYYTLFLKIKSMLRKNEGFFNTVLQKNEGF